MSAQQIKIVKGRSVSDTIQPDEGRALWLAVLHGLTIIVVGIRKYLKAERCEHCGR